MNAGRSQYGVGAYVKRVGNIGSGVLEWFGAASVPVGSETRTNGVFAQGTDGKVYYGATELGGGEPTPPGFKPSKSFARGGYAENTTEIVSIQTVGGSSTPNVRWTQKTFNYGTWTITSPSGVTTRFTNTSSSGERKDVFEWVAEDGATTQSGVVTAYLPGI